MRADTFWKKVKLWILRDRISLGVWRKHFGMLPSTWNIRGGRAHILTCSDCRAQKDCHGSFGVSECNSLLRCMAQKSGFTGKTRCRD